jgi:hypothetical protein
LRFKVTMNEASTKTARKEDDADGVHRLRDIVVEEVSLVDRAANQRRFLIVKRSDDMADESTAKRTGVKKAEAKDPDDEKDAEEKSKRKAADEDDEEDTEKAEGASDDDEEDDASDKRKKKASKDEDDQEDTEKAEGASDDDEEDDASDKRKRSKKRRKQGDALVLPVPEKDALLRVLTESLERLMALASRIKDATPPEDGEEAEVPEEIGEEIEEVTEMLAEADKKKRKRTKAGVAKAGARMSKDRLDRFQKALSLLASILKELTGTKDKDDENKPGEPTAGAAESGVQKRAATIPGLTELATGIGELTRVVKHQEEELARMRKARGVSNTIPVEGGRRAEPQDVSWPLDMNRPISRDKVRKEVSFFDE